MIVIRGTLSTVTLRVRAFLIVVWLSTVRLMEIAKETAAFQIMHQYIAISQFLQDEMLKLIVLASYALFVFFFFFFIKLYQKIPFLRFLS